MTDTSANLSLYVKEISFEKIASFWKTNLWPERLSEIDTVSCITSEGEISLSLKNFRPLFLGIFLNEALIGVVSACQTSPPEVRLRGICILPAYRKRGFSKLLVTTAFQKISTIPGVDTVWTMARSENEAFYMRLGFYTYKKIGGFEYGPHLIMKNSKWRETFKPID